jgi:outer membrane receptor for ferrienterochelin and colicin
MKYTWGYINANYSYYTAKDKNEVSQYTVPGEDQVVLAFPTGRFNLNTSFRAGKNISINPSFNFLGSRFGQTGFDVNDEPVFTKFDPSFYMNLFVQYNNMITDGLSFGAGVYDLFDEGQLFIQPYASGHAPLPGVGRQFLLRLNYSIGFKK